MHLFKAHLLTKKRNFLITVICEKKKKKRLSSFNASLIPVQLVSVKVVVWSHTTDCVEIPNSNAFS